MDRRQLLCSTAGLAGLAAGVPATAQTPNMASAAPPLAAFFSRPLLGAAVLSPLGTKVALRVNPTGQNTDGGQAQLAVLNLDTLKSSAVAAITGTSIDDIVWASDERLVFDTEVVLIDYRQVDYGPGLFGVNAGGGSIRELVATRPSGWLSEGSGNRPALHWHFSLVQPQPPSSNNLDAADEVLVYRPEEISKERVGHHELRWLNARNGVNREVDAPLHSEHWVFDMQRRLRAVLTRQVQDVALMWRDSAEKSPWRTLRKGNNLDGDAWVPLFVDEQDRLFVSAGHQGRTALFTVDTTTGQLASRPLLSHPLYDVHPHFIVADGRLVGLRYTIDAEVTQWLTDDTQQLQAQVDALLPATSNRLTLPLRGHLPWVLVESASDQQPWRALAYQRQSKRLVRLGDSRPGIAAQRMAQTDPVQFKARDGLPIPAWLTLPAGGAKTKLPLVLWVHGGPWARGMSWRWHAEVQFLASRGYAVLQPEFRGSTGHGYAHFRAGWRQWGAAMQTDLADAARWAIDQNIADPARIALLGGSYGGYATLMGLIQEPQLFKAGVAWAAVSDLQMLYSLNWSDTLGEVKRYGLPRLLGDPVADADMLKRHSPLQQAARLQNPLLLAHGGWDARVPADHFEKLRDALQGSHKNLQAVFYPEEGHGWMHTATRVDFWGRVERFLAQHLAPA